MDPQLERLKNALVEKEEQLLDNTVRSDPARLADLVTDGCIEFAASGARHTYRAGQQFENSDGALFILSNSVQFLDLSEDCKALLYVAERVSKNSRTKSNRSSVWKKVDGRWRMVFHQGTACPE